MMFLFFTYLFRAVDQDKNKFWLKDLPFLFLLVFQDSQKQK